VGIGGEEKQFFGWGWESKPISTKPPQSEKPLTYHDLESLLHKGIPLPIALKVKSIPIDREEYKIYLSSLSPTLQKRIRSLEPKNPPIIPPKVSEIQQKIEELRYWGNTNSNGISLVGGWQNLDSRFSESPPKTLGLLIGQMKEIRGSLESRNDRSLASVEWKNSKFYASFGHRFKPIPGFYFAKDPSQYSPLDPLIPQPLTQIQFLGFITKGIGWGGYIKPNDRGLYLGNQSHTWAIAYGADQKEGFFVYRPGTESWNQNWKLRQSMEWIGSKSSFFGFWNLNLDHNLGYRIYSSLYRDQNGKLFQTSPELEPKSSQGIQAGHFTIKSLDHGKLEFFTQTEESRVSKVFGGWLNLWNTNWGNLTSSYRNYEIHTDDQKKLPGIGRGIGWEWETFQNYFLLYYEEREGKDRVSEFKWGYRPSQAWKWEFSAIWNAKSNQIPSLYEQWTDGFDMNASFVDKLYIMKLRITGENFRAVLSGSRKEEGRGDILYINVQYKHDFIIQ
jgi:hypothetical protein